MWQADITAWQLAEGAGHVEIIDMIDDHSRLFLGLRGLSEGQSARRRGELPRSGGAARAAGVACSPTTARCSRGGYRRGKVVLEYELERLGIVFKNSRPYHPQTCGKVERLHQTLKRYLAKQPPPQTLAELQGQLDAFATTTTTSARTGRWGAHAASGLLRPRQGTAAGAHPETYFRVREDKVDKAGKVSLRYDSRLYKIGLGRAHKGRAGEAPHRRPDIRVIDPNGELLRELTLDPSRDYQPIGAAERVYDVPRHLSPMS